MNDAKLFLAKLIIIHVDQPVKLRSVFTATSSSVFWPGTFRIPRNTQPKWPAIKILNNKKIKQYVITTTHVH